MAMVGPDHVLRSSRDFRRLCSGQVLSQLGSQVVLLAVPLVALLSLHARPLTLGLLTACGRLPLLLVGLVAGAWVDRLRCRDVMIAADLARAAVLASVPLAWSLHALTIGQLYAVALLVGTASVFFDAADATFLAHLVDRRRLVEGNAVLQTIASVAGMAGPGLAGVIVGAASAPLGLLVAVAGYLGSALWVASIAYRQPRPETGAERDLVREIRSGLGFLLHHRLMRTMVATSASLNLFASVSGVALVAFMADDLHLRPGTMGVLFACTGVGGVTGGVLVAAVTRRLGQGRSAWISAALLGLPVLLMPLVQRDWRLGVLAAALFCTAFGGTVYNVTVLSFRQAATPVDLLGRVNASISVLIVGMMPLGSLAGGLLSDWLDPRGALWVAGVGAASSFLWIFMSPIRRMHTFESGLEPGARTEIYAHV